ncbi:hypothetical protein AXE80_03555 [Wenyingzhuangia fucanilytica]|uniref:RagB/SusD domain-containing protein n=1 Tax=Wenyingzhuangia fucanilytica TaxID=1790137 RepID=A0A1B1Y3S0_9FLAO|nr:RagB/SusD family nutrient uptake outer membrane protein [Wenyingzhuangia fucanilytica]ANW95410.1 hypothetical protein AXE80_03555 [Wenyingzhuangia fucanilytica]
MKQYIKFTLGLFLGLSLLTSCEDMLNVDPEEVLLSGDYLGDDELDARSALFGVLSQLQEVAGQYIVLGEMRADLVDVNLDTEDELRQLNSLEISNDNSFIDPTTLFSIINNCNFALVGIDTKAYEERLLEDYASIMRIRTWAQMQILINYGKLPYIDKPIRSDDNFKDEYPLLDFNQGLNQLIRNLQAIAGIDNVSRHESSLTFNIESMIPNNDILLGDLFLWSGDYIGAAESYKRFLDNQFDGGPIYRLNNYTTRVEETGTGYVIAGSSWRSIFSNNTPQPSESINIIGFSEQYRQPNNIYDIATTQMKPSESILLNWSAQDYGYEGVPVQIAEYPYDYRYYSSVNQLDPELLGKYQEEYFMWNRAAKIYLRYAEAINYAGYPEHALAILNGIFNNPDVEPKDAPIFNNAQTFLNFDLDAYFTTNNSDEPISGLLGVRDRAGLAPVSVPSGLTQSETIDQVGALILNEAALELAFEGNRWEDLVRFSRRANDPSIIADAVANKFELAGNAAQANSVRQKLSNPSNWFLHLDVPDNFVEQ